MRNKHTARLAVGASLALAATALGSPSASAAPAAPAARAAHETTSLAQVLAGDGNRFDKNWSDFDVLDRAVHVVLRTKKSSPVAVLADGRTRLTAFAPTDRAFRRLARALTGRTPQDERQTWRKLAGAVDVDTLETVLLYHVVPGRTLTSPKVLAADGKRLKTAQGGRVGVEVRGKRVVLVDRDPDAANAQAKPRLLDINRGNRQVAHGINQVLRPIDL